MARGERPLIVRRVIQPRPTGHHGGAWKVAYADFVTALMALFLLLWLISSASKDMLEGLADYFTEARITTSVPAGSSALLAGRTLLPVETPSTLPLLTSAFQIVTGALDDADEADPWLLAARRARAERGDVRGRG